MTSMVVPRLPLARGNQVIEWRGTLLRVLSTAIGPARQFAALPRFGLESEGLLPCRRRLREANC
jgi:hypothetical protein